jgi:hypothetical protein
MPRCVLVLLLTLVAPVAAVEWTSFEGAAHGFPVLRDQSGRKIADGDFAQWIEGGRLRVRITYTGGGQRIVESAVLRQQPELAQDSWSLREERNGKLQRLYEVDFGAGTASATKQETDGLKHWSDTIRVTPGRAFAGFGFSLAIKGIRAQLIRGQRVELEAVGFTPKPRVVPVAITYAGVDRVSMAERTLRGERFIVHPELPWIARFFVKVPDAQIWLTTAPATFLRWEGPLAEPTDALMRIDLLPGATSGAATPIATSGNVQ